MGRGKFYFFERKRQTKVICVFGILLIMLLGGSILRVATRQTDVQAIALAGVKATGLLQANIYNLNFQNVSGNISEIYVVQGQRVTKGKVLARLDATILEETVNVAQVTVDAARHYLDSSKVFADKAIDYHHTQIEAAETAVAVSKDNKDAVHHQSHVHIEAAEETLEADRRTLKEAKKALHDQIELSKAQLARDLEACNPTPDPKPTPDPTPKPAPMPDPTPTPTPAPAPDPTPAPPTSPTPTPSASPTSPASPTPAQMHPEIGKFSANGALSRSVQLCRQLAHAQFERDVQLARLVVASAQADVIEDEQDLKKEKADAEVNNTRVEGEVDIAKSLLDIAKDIPDEFSARAQVTFAEGQLDIAIAQLDLAKSNLNNATLIAPHDGVITAINGEVGAVPGLKTVIYSDFSSSEGGTFIQITDTSSVSRVLISVNEADILKVKVGQKAQFTVKAYNNRVFSGTITAISPNGIFNGTSSSYPVIMNIDPESTYGTTLLPNMSASVTILKS